jgi:hypothetical protein
MAVGHAVFGVAGGGPGRAPAVRRRRLPRVSGRRPGQQAGPAPGHRCARRFARPQAGPAELRRTRRLAGHARPRAHRGVRRIGPGLRKAAASVLGSAAPPLPGSRSHGGRDGRRGVRRVASARVGPGPLAREGLPSRRSGTRAGRLARWHAPIVAGAHRRAGQRRSVVRPASRDGPRSGVGPAVRVVRRYTECSYSTTRSIPWTVRGPRRARDL